ncbi:tyrosine-type recombinase/integrase [Kitasatospora sp. NPDC056783]|uniref:tyrosine-type recombinase/integrase n=1 Tax=Kitasatospora sp. NPDC056783 TaxID=3345943 RepID=UPI0036AB7BF3
MRIVGISMVVQDDDSRDILALVVPQVGCLAMGLTAAPYRLLDPGGVEVGAAAVYFADLQAMQRPATTLRSYGMDLLRWFRFLWAVEVPWDRAARVDARDFSRWIALADKPARVHWRRAGREPAAVTVPSPGQLNPVTGKLSAGSKYAASTVVHSETVLRGFYDFHRERGSGPLVNPFPLHRSRRGGREHAHHNPMEPFRHERAGLYRLRVPQRIPRSIPDERFNEIFAKLPSHRDRALIAFYVSTGARASELLSATQGGVLPGQQLISVVRKGTRAVQQLPASSDAFVWLRLYQLEMEGLVPRGRTAPLWWTLRRPFRPLNYQAAHRMFERVNAAIGADWTLHDLRHTAAYRMAEDPELPLTDVQFVLGHALLTTTQVYLTPRREEVVRRMLAHHAQQARRAAERKQPVPAPGYRPQTMEVLFGGEAR